jgi:acetolactate synthase-1/2/3 large subunit
MFGAAASRPRLSAPLSEFIARVRIPFFNTQMGKGAVEGGSHLYMGTAALSERDYVHRAIDRADLILSIGHDTVEKPPFIMGPDGPRVIHVGYLPATVEEVFFPHAEIVGDVGPSLALLADRLDGKLKNAAALLPLREDILAHLTDRATESRFPLTPQRIIHDVRQAVPDVGIVCLDNGMFKIWFAQLPHPCCEYTASRQCAGDNGRWTACGDRRRAHPSCAARARRVRRRWVYDELAGDGNRRAAQAQPGRASPRG